MQLIKRRQIYFGTENTNRFTMIEMLVVVAIIAVALGLLIPAASSIFRKAKVNKSKTSIRNLHLAIKQYETTYGYLPFTPLQLDQDISVNATAGRYAELLNTLNASDVGLNPRQIKFLEVDKNNNYRDSWDNDFEVSLDLNYDGNILDTYVVGDSVNLNTNVAVYSKGPDGQHDTTSDANASNEDNIKSWDNN